MKLGISILSLLLFSFLGGHVYAGETIESFHSDIKVMEDGSMLVKETIVVNAEGKNIKQGIYRDFPTRYKDRMGNAYKVGFEIVSVKHDYADESYHTAKRSNGVRIYIGKKGRNISRGKHRYELTYLTTRQLGFFDEYDELYWNVTGNDWAFTILKASASITLPDGIDPDDLQLKAFTGPTGSTAQDYESTIRNSKPYFETTRYLYSGEGLTIVVGFPKGFVYEPTFTEKAGYLLEDNEAIVVMAIGMLILLGYYWFTWVQVGKDPEQGVIIPHYEPPADYSPAAVRYIREMGYDQTCFTVALVNLAVKGHLTISDEGKDYVISRSDIQKEQPTRDENRLLKNLFSGASTLTLERTNHRRISKALTAHEEALDADYEKKYFNLNSLYFAVGLFASALVILAGFLTQITSGVGEKATFLTIWLSMWSVGVCVLIANAWRAWKRVKGVVTLLHAFATTAFAVPFVFFEIMAAGMLVEESSLTFPLMIVIIILINWIFYELLKAPTRAGRKLLDKIDGFRKYIEIAEKHELAYKNAGGKTPELFERILPYAIALEIDDIWGKQFEDVLSKAAYKDDAQYSPGWYRGSNWNASNIGGFTRSVGSSLGSAIASSSTAPGSSSGGGFSGGGGGGSSGGGGGGGGGGGW